MLAHHIMSKNVITVSPHTPIEEAAKIMLQDSISSLPVVDEDGLLIGIVSESDFLHRREIGTGHRRPRWLQFFVSPAQAAAEFVKERGIKIKDIMTEDVVTVGEATPLAEIVSLMEKRAVKRLPVVSGNMLKGILTRSNIMQAVASTAREMPTPTVEDEKIRDRILGTVNVTNWRPIRFEVLVRMGVVDLFGMVRDDKARQAAIVAAESTVGVRRVRDHIYCWDLYPGSQLQLAQDTQSAK